VVGKYPWNFHRGTEEILDNPQAEFSASWQKFESDRSRTQMESVRLRQTAHISQGLSASIIRVAFTLNMNAADLS
jgi:hypothetical protein